MGKFIKKFHSHEDYEIYIESGADLPNVSRCYVEKHVHFNPKQVPTPWPYDEEQYRWVVVVGSYECSGTTKMTAEKKQKSTDGGKTWSDVVPAETRAVEPVIEECSVDCGCEPEGLVVATFNVTDTSNPTNIGYNQYISGFSSIYIDGVRQPSVVSAYTFSTTGEHTVKYELSDSTSIGDNAFEYCRDLTSVNIPSGVTWIGEYAFNNCSGLTSIDIPSGVTWIGGSTFNSCGSLTSCTIGSGVKSIGSNAFDSCRSLTSIDIPSGVTWIGEYAFSQCRNLTSIVSNAMTAPTIDSSTFYKVSTGGTLTVPSGSSGYDVWMQNANYYLGLYNWTKVEQ